MLPPRPIQVLVADSHEMVRSGLALLLEIFDDLELVGEASNGIETLRLCAQLQPDVVLISPKLPPTDGFDTTRLIREQYKKSLSLCCHLLAVQRM
jgi:DNA-binding NarL/FixJ family response regulator